MMSSLQQDKSHRKIKQWPDDHQIFAKLVHDAIAAGTSPNTMFTELDPIEPEINRPYLSPERTEKRVGPWGYAESFLHRALRIRLYELAEFLLESGAEVDKRNGLGRTPLHEAVLDRNWQAVGLLIKNGSDIEALTIASNIVWYKGGEAVSGEGGLTPMHLALYNSDVDMLRLLVSLGANIDHRAEDSWSYLDLALLQEDPEATDFFLCHGLKLHKDPFGFTDPKESKVTAQKLQAYVTSRHMIPPKDLWSSYKEVLSRLHFCKWAIDMEDDEDPPTTDLIVTTFSEHLETLAGQGSDYRQFCDDCWQLAEELCFFYQQNNTNDVFEYRPKPSRQALLETAEREWSCALCSYIADSLDFTESNIRNKKKLPAEWKASEGPVDVCFSMVDVPWDLNRTVKTFKGACGSSGLCPEMSGYPDGLGFHHNFDWINSLDLPPSYEADDGKLGTGSQRAFKIAQKWLRDCKIHKLCRDNLRKGASGTYRPRLLHVGDNYHAPRLVEDPGDNVEYVAFSNCSDDSSAQSIQTTSDNLEKRKVSIKFENLPAMFGDAILVTRRLGFEYIWIEDVCIVQDSADARSERTDHLHSVYNNASLTISKVNATSTSESLFTPRISRSLHPVPLKIWQPKCRRPAYSEGTIHSFALVRDEYAKDPTLGGSNHQTVWSLQAELFSSRTLHFGSGMLHWECLCGYKNEALSPRSDYVETIVDKRLKPRAVFRGVSTEHTAIGSANSFSPMGTWQFLLETYSDRELSKVSDRLPAFWAVGKHMEGILEDEFYCGLWKGKHFLQSLCWAAMAPSTAKPVLPTWTWASNQQQLTFACLDTTGRQHEALPLAKLVSWNAGMFPNTHAASGTLTLRGPLYPLENCSKDWTLDAKYLDFERAAAPWEGVDEDIYPSVFDGINVTGCYVLEILAFRGTTGKGIAGDGWQWPAGRNAGKVALLLESVDEKDAVFRRAGVLTMDFVKGNLNPKTFQDEALQRTITLV